MAKVVSKQGPKANRTAVKIKRLKTELAEEKRKKKGKK